jgi:hypothetical protein
MAGFARIEKCQTQAIAQRRRDALVALKFTAIIVQDVAIHVTSDITVDAGGTPQPQDQRTQAEAPWLVIGVRDH